MSETRMIHVVADVQSCDAEVYLNDVPVARLLEYEAAAISLPVHPLIVDGANELKLVINPGPTPAQAEQHSAGPPIKPDARGRARLVVLAAGALPSGDIRPLVEVEYHARGSDRQGPLAVNATGSLPFSFGTRVWETGSRIDSLSPEIESSALVFVNQVRDVLQRGDPKRLAPLLRSKVADAAASYGMDGAQQLAVFVSHWEAFAKTPNWKLAPIDAQRASLRLCGRGRFIECVAKDWNPLIRLDDLSAGGVLMGMGIARIGNQWAIVY